MSRLPAVALLLALTACGSGDAGEPGDPGGDDRTLTVLAAASLTGAFDDLAEIFEDAHPGVEVRLSLDSSATLAQQVIAGAPADVLATADLRTMTIAADGDALADDPRTFATNTLVLVTPADDPAGITAFADITGTAYVTCAESAPCGAIARDLLAANGIESPPVSREVDVRAVLTKVVLGEADAGLVYATDAAAAGDEVRTLPVPGAPALRTEYPIALLAAAPAEDLGRAWVDLVRSAEGQQVLARHGFGPAPS